MCWNSLSPRKPLIIRIIPMRPAKAAPTSNRYSPYITPRCRNRTSSAREIMDTSSEIIISFMTNPLSTMIWNTWICCRVFLLISPIWLLHNGLRFPIIYRSLIKVKKNEKTFPGTCHFYYDNRFSYNSTSILSRKYHLNCFFG